MTFGEKILEAAEEGIVLLKNENKTLPIAKNETVSVFGRCQFDFYKCGMGSGGSVRSPYSTNLIDYIPNANKELKEIYKSWVNENPFDNGGGGWAKEPFFQKEMFISDSLALAAAKISSKAIFVIGRNAGEDKDLSKEKGQWLLTDDEKNSIKTICKFFDSVIIVFNTCGIIETSWINDSKFNNKIKSVVYAWQGGQESGRACANVLLGKTPSGKLNCTIAKSIDDYPSTKNFATLGETIYAEDIYVGYRYFSTFAKDKILYPFGFGLSYTSFETKFISSFANGNDIHVKVSVQNVGHDFSGKETVQLYCEAPQGKLGKPKKVLVAFKKTSLLKHGESEQLELNFNIESIASYDDSGKSNFRFSFVLEEGEYFVYMGTDSESAQQIPIGEKNSFVIEKTYATEKLCQALAPEKAFNRIKPIQNKDGSFTLGEEKVPLKEYDLAKRIKDSLPKEIAFTGDKGIKFLDVKKDISLLDDFVAQLTSEELATLVRGEGMMSRKATMGIASAFGGLSEDLYNYGIPVAGCADGPSGIRIDTGKEASLMPTGTLLACSWNPSLVQELFEYEGKELKENQIDVILGPGINIQRNPLNGRNFEYFSEDPLLTGIMATSILKGIAKHGCFATIKHFACNNQETERNGNNSIVSERALREIYLKPFEIAIKQGNASSLMTSYNQINGHFTASNYDLNVTILRNNWKYSGFVMTDWWAKMNDCVQGGKGSIKKTSCMVRALNDVYMVVGNDSAEIDGNDDDIKESLKNGSLTIAELQACAKNIIKFLTKSLVSERPLRSLNNIPSFEPTIKELKDRIKPIEENVQFMCNGETKRIFVAEEDGIYNVIGVYSKETDKKTVSQSICNVLVDGIPTFAFECRSTDGKKTSAIIGQVKLKKGYYEISLDHTKPGINIIFVGLSRVISTASGIEGFSKEGEPKKQRILE